MSTKKSVGDQPVFPGSEQDFTWGISYRQWLIGQVAAGNDIGQFPLDEEAEHIILLADAIIARLDKEA